MVKKKGCIGRTSKKKGHNKAYVEPSKSGTTSLKNTVLNTLKYGGNDMFKIITKGVQNPPVGGKHLSLQGEKRDMYDIDLRLKKRRRCENIGPEDRSKYVSVDGSDTEIESESESENDAEYLPNDDASVEEIGLEGDEEFCEVEEHLYSTFNTESKVFCTSSNKIGVAFFYMNSLGAPEPEQ